MTFKALVADPPWRFGDSLPGKGRGAAKHYATMSVEEICAFELPPLHADCWLFLWRPATHQREAIQVADAWDFERAPSELIWRKVTNDGFRVRIGMGRSVRNAHETCLIFKRGKPERLSMSIPSVFNAPRTEHSEKPEKFYRLVDKFCPGPKVELFARRQWGDWTCLGDEMPRQRWYDESGEGFVEFDTACEPPNYPLSGSEPAAQSGGNQCKQVKTESY